jgi:hypothetical protein
MKRASIWVTGLALAVGFVPGPAAAQSKASDPASVVYDAATAMEYFRSLSGDWVAGTAAHEHGEGRTTAAATALSFKTKAAGSAVVQTTRQGTPGEMESIFHMDGDELLLTHYCALQNAPVLKFVKTNKPGEIKFAFKGGTNFDPAVDAHFHEGTFYVKDKDTFEQTFTVFTNGKATPEGRSTLRRKQAQ